MVVWWERRAGRCKGGVVGAAMGEDGGAEDPQSSAGAEKEN